MSTPASFLVALGQCLAKLALYPVGHPSRERAIDGTYEQLLALVSDVQFAAFSFVGSRILYGETTLDELRGWEWGDRFTAAGIERLEIDADVTRVAWDRAVDELWHQLHGKPLESHANRQLVATSVRFGRLRVMGGEALETNASATPAPALPEPVAVSLKAEVATISWIHEEVLSSDRIPMAEVEAVIGSLALSMKSDQHLLLPLLRLKRFDQYTTTHACNVAVLSMGLAEALGCSRAEVRAFGVAGLLHDIGKVTVPRDILTKPGRLTDEEREIMATHPAEGARILLEQEKGMQLAAVVAYEHHICIDGRGYPRLHFDRGCHLASRLVHVCDIFDALTTERPYRRPWSPAQAVGYLQERAGTEVDPDIVRVFATMLETSSLGRLDMTSEPTFTGPPAAS
jgi:putative nucleotidyltransferase with HDIG domain